MQQQANGIMGAAPNTRGNSADASLGGMAQAVDTKVEAYRNNPQALEKRLAGNQQLLDLLALQKVKSEKESAANQLLLSEQQNPNTILEQREKEVLAMNKNEVAKQTAGILGQRQKQQQKNMQRTAKGAPQGAPMGAPEQPTMMAASGGLMPLPRPNMQRMAQGGVIGYQGGGQVDRIKDFIAQRGGKLTQQEMKDLVNASKNDPKIISFLTQNQGYISSAEMAEMDKAAMQPAPAGVPIANAPSSVPADDVPEGAVVQKEDAPEDFKPLKAIGEGASALGELIKNNPLEALSVGLMFVPGIGWGMAGYRAAKAVNYAVKAKKAYDTGKKGIAAVGQAGKEGIAAVGQAGVRGAKGAVSRSPKLPTRNAKGQITKQGEAGNMFGGTRMASPNRQAAVIGTGYGIAKAKGAFDQSISDGVDASIADIEAQQKAKQEAEYQTGLSNIMTGMQAEQDDMNAVASPAAVEPTLAEQTRTAGTQGLPTLEENIATAKSSTRMTDSMKASGLQAELEKRLDTTGIPAAQKAAMAASDKNLGRSAKRDEINALVEEERGYTKSQLDPEKLRKERLMANLIGGGQRGLLGVAMGGQQADAQAAKFENSQRGKVVKMIQDRQKNDIDIAKIGEANARNVYSTLHAKSDAAMRAMVDVSQADLEAADRAAAEFIARYDQEINVKFKEIDAKYKDKILEAQNIADQGKRLATLLTLYTEIQKSISEGLAYDTRYSSGAETAAKIQADPNYKFDDPEEKDDLAYYEGILARSIETQKSFDIVQKAIKEISGIDTTKANFNDV